MNPILFDIPTELDAERICLRAVRPGDGAIVYPSVRESLPELKVWMPWAIDDYNEQGAEEWCRKAAASFIERIQYLILLRENNQRRDWLLATHCPHRPRANDRSGENPHGHAPAHAAFQPHFNPRR
jgi:hypothetical protein